MGNVGENIGLKTRLTLVHVPFFRRSLTQSASILFLVIFLIVRKHRLSFGLKLELRLITDPFNVWVLDNSYWNSRCCSF